MLKDWKTKRQTRNKEISTVYMSFSKRLHSSIVFAALYLSSYSVSARTGVLGRKRTGVDRGGRGLKTSKNVWISVMDNPILDCEEIVV